MDAASAVATAATALSAPAGMDDCLPACLPARDLTHPTHLGSESRSIWGTVSNSPASTMRVRRGR
jgi:hypothetical protein